MCAGIYKLISFFAVIIWVHSETPDFPSLLIANRNGVYFINKTISDKIPLILYSTGAKDVSYNFKTKEVYAILKSSDPNVLRIVRTMMPGMQENRSCDISFEEWCMDDKTCHKNCNYGGSYSPKLVIKEDCLNARNLNLDWNLNKIYWTCDLQEGQNATIRKTTASGMSSDKIVHSDKNIIDLAVEPREKKVFILWPKTLEVRDLNGTNEKKIPTLQDTDMTSINLDIQNKIIYILASTSAGEVFLATMNYTGGGFEKLYPAEKVYPKENPNSRLGPEIMGSVLYRIAKSKIVWSAKSSGVRIEMKGINYKETVNGWEIYHGEDQTIEKDIYENSVTRTDRSLDVSNEAWRQESKLVTPQDNTEDETSTFLENNTGLDQGDEGDTNYDIYSTPDENGSTDNRSTDKGSAYNGSNYSDESSTPSTEDVVKTSAVVSASSGSLTALFLVIATVCIFILIVIIVVWRRAKRGNFTPETVELPTRRRE